MTEEPAPRAPHAPQATYSPAPARGEGPGPDRPPQGHTALRERLAEALRNAAYVCPGDTCTLSEDECGENQPIVLAAATVIDGIPEATLIDGEVYAIADAVLPVVEEAVAEKDAEIRRLGEAVDADGGRIHRLRVDLAEQAQTLRAVEIDRDEWRNRAHRWKATAGPSEDSDEYDLDTDPDALRRCLAEVIDFMECRPARMIHDAVWARVRPVLRIFREKLTEQTQRAEQAEAAVERVRTYTRWCAQHDVEPDTRTINAVLDGSDTYPYGDHADQPKETRD